MTWSGELPMIDPAHYVFGDERARGGLGRIIEARDRRMERTVAIKQLIDPTSPANAARLVREALVSVRLQHPGILPVYEAGRWPNGEPFYAMKLVRGHSLEQEIAERHSLEERLALLPNVIAVAEAVAYAHTENVVHCDLKPSNVLIGPFGETAVIDWGLAKELRASGAPAVDAPIAARAVPDGESARKMRAYTAPEQARGDEVDARADVYAIGAILYHLLSGEPPDAPASTAPASTPVFRQGKSRISQKSPGAPSDLLVIVEKSMAHDPSRRYLDAGGLLDDLRRFQTGQLVSARSYTAWELLIRWVRRFRVALGLAASVLVAGGGAAWKFRRERRALVSTHEQTARALIGQADGAARSADGLRKEAIANFEKGLAARDAAEAQWSQVMQMETRTDSLLGRSIREFELALLLDPAREDTHVGLAEAWDRKAELARVVRNEPAFEEAVQRLSTHDRRRRHLARWTGPAVLHIESDPPGARVLVGKYRTEDDGRRVLGEEKPIGTTPLDGIAVEAGSYRLTFHVEGRPIVYYPLSFEPSQREQIAVRVPSAEQTPVGFVYIPAGRFYEGWLGDVGWRRSFLRVPPLYETRTSGFFMAQNETTYRDWIAYLRALPSEERRRKMSSREDRSTVEIALDEQADQSFVFSFRLGEKTLRAAEGQPIVYAKRDRRLSQNWLNFPILALSVEQAVAYTKWLAMTGRVKGARLCNEYEWTRAARGGDTRNLPQGDNLAPDDANFDETYRKGTPEMGPDEIRSHPTSRSPYGIEDMIGNGEEFVQSWPRGETFFVVGGAFRYSRAALQIPNVTVVEPTFSETTTSMRVCADDAPQ